MLVGDFYGEPTKIPCLAKGISAGLWVDLEAAWALASGRQPGVTCKRSWDSTGGSRRDFMVGCPRAAAAVSKGRRPKNPSDEVLIEIMSRFPCAKRELRVHLHVEKLKFVQKPP